MSHYGIFWRDRFADLRSLLKEIDLSLNALYNAVQRRTSWWRCFRAPAAIWKAITSGDLMSRWFMAPCGFEPVEGCRFTFKTTPAGP